jgi:hypothetical protein
MLYLLHPKLRNIKLKRHLPVLEDLWLQRSSCYVLRKFCSFPARTEWLPWGEFCCYALPMLSFCKIAEARDSVVKKPQEEYTGSVMLQAELTVDTTLEQSSIIA